MTNIYNYFVIPSSDPLDYKQKFRKSANLTNLQKQGTGRLPTDHSGTHPTGWFGQYKTSGGWPS